MRTAPISGRRWTLPDGVLSGGAGNRTPVREEIDHSHYVRSPLLNVSTRWLADGPRMDEPS